MIEKIAESDPSYASELDEVEVEVDNGLEGADQSFESVELESTETYGALAARYISADVVVNSRDSLFKGVDRSNEKDVTGQGGRGANRKQPNGRSQGVKNGSEKRYKAKDGRIVVCKAAQRLLFSLASKIRLRAEKDHQKSRNEQKNIKSQTKNGSISLQLYQPRKNELTELKADNNDPDLRRFIGVETTTTLSDEALIAMLAPIESQTLEEVREGLASLMFSEDEFVSIELTEACEVWEKMFETLEKCRSLCDEAVVLSDAKNTKKAIHESSDAFMELASVACRSVNQLLQNV